MGSQREASNLHEANDNTQNERIDITNGVTQRRCRYRPSQSTSHIATTVMASHNAMQRLRRPEQYEEHPNKSLNEANSDSEEHTRRTAGSNRPAAAKAKKATTRCAPAAHIINTTRTNSAFGSTTAGKAIGTFDDC